MEMLIVGQGLAGTALAWEAFRRGLPFRIVDREGEATSSRVAGGLVTPVTGRRLVKNLHLDRTFPALQSLTRFTAETLKCRDLFRTTPVVRLLKDEAEKELWATKSSELAGEWRPLADSLPSVVRAPMGAFEWVRSGWLDVPAYLDRSRRFFIEGGFYEAAEVDPESCRDRKSPVVFCQGYNREANPFFDWIPFRPAKGELLTLRLSGYREARTINGGGLWLKPHNDSDLYRLGATYDWECDDAKPTEEGRSELEKKFRLWFEGPYEVVEHLAGVRPVIEGRQPVIGRHPVFEHLCFFNGLGSKGVLEGPWFAACLLDHLQHGSPVPEEYNVRKNL